MNACSKHNYCGKSDAHYDGGTDCTGCNACPAACSQCQCKKDGVCTDSNVCKNWCSRHNYCGATPGHINGGTNCTGCIETKVTTEASTGNSKGGDTYKHVAKHDTCSHTGFLGRPMHFRHLPGLGDITMELRCSGTGAKNNCISTGKRACSALPKCWGFSVFSAGVYLYNSKASNFDNCEGEHGLRNNMVSHSFYVKSSGQVASTKFVAIDNGAGCDLSVDVEKDDCTTAATKLGYLGSFESGRWGNKPPGCFVGNSDDNWARIYFNEMSEGTLGMSKYKSICQKGWFLGGAAENCNTVCQNNGLACSKEGFARYIKDVNTGKKVMDMIGVLGGSTSAASCANGPFGASPAFNADKFCIFTTASDKFDCSVIAKPISSNKRRLCYCK